MTSTNGLEERRFSDEGRELLQVKSNDAPPPSNPFASSLELDGAAAAGDHGSKVKKQVHYPQMTPSEAAQITVSYDELESGRLQAVMASHGAAIITGCAPPAECKALQELFAADLNEIIDHSAARKAGKLFAKVAKSAVQDPATWPIASLHLLGELNRCQLRGLPHGRFAWGVRLLPRLRAVYQCLYGAEASLVSSCDNAFFAPAAQEEAKTNRPWPHVDQNSNDARLYDEEGRGIAEWDVYQGLLYVWDSLSSRSSTTVLLPGSHQGLYGAMMADAEVQARGHNGVHFTPVQHLRNAELKAQIRQAWRAGARRVTVPAGGLLLWDSKTLHQGWSGGPRLAQPVCWEPVGRRWEQAYERKLRMAALGLPSTHWASLGIQHNLVTPAPATATKPGQQRRSGKSQDNKDVQLPVRSTINPVVLEDGVSAADVWEVVAAADWVKPLPAAQREFLERVVRADFKDVL